MNSSSRSDHHLFTALKQNLDVHKFKNDSISGNSRDMKPRNRRGGLISAGNRQARSTLSKMS